MAHQSKFVSVNLNKSYGQPISSSSVHGRLRSGSAGGGGSGGMVVLSRARSSVSSSAKAAQKLAIPPPLNLPSLRKEHERFDPASAGSGAGNGSLGLGSRTGSSILGWSKPEIPPASSSVPEKDGSIRGQDHLGRSAIAGNELGGNPYMPPGARPGGQLPNVASAQGFREKAVILKGEDFPSLRATFSSAPKQREALKQKQKQRQGIEEQSNGREVPVLHAPLQMRPQIRSSRLITDNVSDVDGGSIQPLGSSDNLQKQNGHMPALLPQVLLHHTSDWTDDERDTGLCIPERERDHGFSRSESVQIHDAYNDRLLQDTGTSSPWSRDFLKSSSLGRDLHNATNETHEFGSSRFSTNPRDRPNVNAFGANKDRHNVRPSSGSREINVDGINAHSFYGENFGDGFGKRSQDYRYQRKELGSLESLRIDNKMAFSGNSAAKNVHNQHNGYPSSWSKGTSFQNNTLLKGQSLINNKATSLSNPILNSGREKPSSSSGVKPFLEDAEFDSKDSFSGSMRDMNAKVLKKKVLERQIDLHDPVRESFEAEVEKILRLREEEHQHVLEEQARALELARKEEEEKERLAKEEEERRRLLEEEARELALREEQEKLEIARRVEEQRIAREEEKRRYQMEEERRKEAARKKLLELEARISRRQAENKGKDNRVPTFSNEQIPDVVRERDITVVAEDGGWEDGERMVERITDSGFSDSSSVDRFLEVGSRSQFPRDSFPSVIDRGKYSYVDSVIPSLDEENAYQNQRQDVFGYKRTEFHCGTEPIPSRPSSKEVMMESSQMPDEYREQRKPRWSSNKRLDYFKRNNDADAEFNDDLKFGDVRMVQGNSHGSYHAQYNELSSDYSVDNFSSFTRSCQLPRQPHVPPPPYVAPLHRNSFRDTKERASPSCFIDNDNHYSHASRYDHQVMLKGNDHLFHESLQQTPKAASFEGNSINSEQESEKMSARCGSQLSLSVSSPPSSPALLSHHEMDVSRDSPPLPASADGDHTIVSDSEHIVFPLEGGTMDRMATSSSVSPEVDDEWPVAVNEETLENECHEFRDIAEMLEGDNTNLHQVQDMEDLQSDTQTCNMEQVILGFNEGVEIKLPNIDSIEISSSDSEKEFKLHAVPVGCLEELITNGEISARKGTADSYSTNISEMEQALHILSLDPAGASDYSASSFEASESSRLLDQPMIPATSLSMASSTTDPPSLSFPSIVSQVQAPVNLQFGLFSGPSLIPSPIQAIQIGSIQMPIHSYTHTSPSLPQVSSHCPLFQFGQLRYAAPILSESTLPLVPHGTSISHPPVPAPYSFNQNPAGCLSKQAAQNISQMTKPQDEKPSGSSANQISLVQKIVEPSAGNLLAEQIKPFVETRKNASVASQKWTNSSTLGDKKVTNESVCHAESHVYDNTNEKRSYRFNGRRKVSQPQQHGEFHSSRHIPGLKAPPGTLAGGQRKRYAHSVRTSARAPSYPNMDELQGDLSGFPRRSKRHNHRTEFRVRDNIQGKKTQSTESLNNMGLDENSVATGITIRNLGKKDEALTKSTRLTYQSNDSSSGASTSQSMSSDRNVDKVASNESISKSTNFGKSHAGKGNTNASDILVDYSEVPLLNGVVRVFKQTGIEVPSNEDDFIEVRSKRQMLNDRREQRAKENKSKARVQKAPVKESTALQSSAFKTNSNKSVAYSLGDTANSVCSNTLTAGVKGSTKLEASLTFTANFSPQALPPIGIPSVNIGSEKRLNQLKSSLAIPKPAVSDSEAMPMFGPSENKNVNHGYSALSLSSWDNENLAIDLTQTQLDEAMKPSHFDSIVASSNVLEPPKFASSAVTLENTYPSLFLDKMLSLSNSFGSGAVILPNVLPSVSQTISKVLGPPDSGKSDFSKDQNLANSNHAMFLVKEKCSSQSSANLEDAEAEAEAAASAIAVAAITNDEIIGPVIGSSSDTKTYSSADGSALAARGDKISPIFFLSSSEESLTVALPADLSVDTPLSVWSALQSPQASMSMLSQFSGAPPSHFPSFEMNRIVDGCLFSYGSNDESVGSQSQSQNGSLGSSTLAAWPQYHSGVDSFYHPPAGYNGTFISPGGMPGVQCPSPMVVYNHFPPVGQFGQIGLGYMGTAYIPAGKQPEWSQKQVFSNARDNDIDPSNRNTVSGQGTPTTARSSVHNLGPGSSLMVASPLTMFDMNPFQSTANIPLQAWSPVPPPLHSVSLSIPLQQQLPPPLPENRIPLQFGRTGDTSMGNNKSDVPHASASAASAEVSENISTTNSAVPIMSLELDSAKQPTSSTSNNKLARPLQSTINVDEKKVASTRARAMGAVVNHGGCISSSSSRPSGQVTDAHSETQPPSMPGSSHLLVAGYGDQQRGNVNRAGSGGDWHRRFQFKKQGTSADKNIAPKMKQIYVAKPSSSGASNQG
ncbi:hypothetical protein ZIOFF_033677 [Zingiber officinale]|uniref:Uncharacterized protein n=1 Tax=Zingiber officinale TaxID=94328 RepID=A0A8J5GXD3_ZINOF|nr:hypothetical protein ZIOFF_033677 [Zingiber officinale]